MRSWNYLVFLVLFWSHIEGKPEFKPSRKKIPVNDVVNKACRGELHEAYRLTDKVRSDEEKIS